MVQVIKRRKYQINCSKEKLELDGANIAGDSIGVDHATHAPSNIVDHSIGGVGIAARGDVGIAADENILESGADCSGASLHLNPTVGS